ncbi:MAG: M81 family metallopeptidase [Pirellulales bacterium]|jgi:microcystin degradation protein MlrC
MSALKIAIAQFGQETSSFSSTQTTLDTFKKFGLYEGDAFRQQGFDGGAVGGFMETGNKVDLAWEPIPIIRGWAGASGPLTDETLAYFVDKITDALKRADQVDALYLDLHGAAVAHSHSDCEGHLLQACRNVLGDSIPIVLALDHHANLTNAIVEHCDALVAHRTQPHHPWETGQLAAILLFDILQGKLTPTIAWKKIPLITHQEQFLTSPAGPMREWFELAREIESLAGVVSASTFPMQPWIDVPEGGWAVSVVTNNDMVLAEKHANRLAQFAWDQRDRFLQQESIPPSDAIRQALKINSGLVILSDTGDSVFGGAPGDSTIVLKEIIRQEVQQPVLLTMVDPEVVEQAIVAGMGSTLQVELGGKQSGNYSTPIKLTTLVSAIGGGEIQATCVGTDSFSAGRAVVLTIGNIQIVVSETAGVGGNHPATYEHFGIDPRGAKMIVLKTASNFQYYADWTSQIIRVDTQGATMSDISGFNWQQLPRPIYPLDPITTFNDEL